MWVKILLNFLLVVSNSVESHHFVSISYSILNQKIDGLPTFLYQEYIDTILLISNISAVFLETKYCVDL